MADASKAQQKPALEARWFYARKKGWAVFSNEDNEALERKWLELGGENIKRRTDEALTEEEYDGPSASTSQNGSAQPDEKQKPKRTPLLRAPPSGVNAVESALRSALPKSNSKDKPSSNGNDKKKKQPAKIMVNRKVDPALPPSHPERRAKVAVLEDHLFDADVETMVMYPAFFKGVLVKIVRATYFYSSLTDASYAPVSYDEPLSRELEQAYERIQPWRFEQRKPYSDKYEDQLVELKCMQEQSGRVHWEDASTAKLFSVDITGRFLSILGGSRVIRGFAEADRLAREMSSSRWLDSVQDWLPWGSGSDSESSDEEDEESAGRRSTARKERGQTRAAGRQRKKFGASQVGSKRQGAGAGMSGEAAVSAGLSFATRLWPSREDSIWLAPVNAMRKLFGADQDELQRRGQDKNTEQAMEGEPTRDELADPEPPSDCASDPPELVLCIHGIGQELAGDFDALNFVYDVQRLRATSRECAASPDIRRMSRGRRAQFLPICWRSGLSFDRKVEGNDNFFTLMDVSNNASIPVVRNVITKVILDVPFYLSSHRKLMIDAVRNELNRVYRLFLQRNPNFEREGGRVSLICHSLGSALACDLLSAQPTRVSLLSELSEEAVEKDQQQHLLFNVKNCCFIGSPVGFFCYLDGGQLIARQDTDRSDGMDDDAVRVGPGKYGCMAAEAFYNCYHTSDPVAYRLAPACDQTYASVTNPVAISDATEAILESLSLPHLSIKKLFEGDDEGKSPFSALKRFEKTANIADDGARDGFKLRALERGEKRFKALNPFGSIDFVMGAEGITEYLEMLTAHNSYWTSKTFNLFLLTFLFMKRELVPDKPKFSVSSLQTTQPSQKPAQGQRGGAAQGERPSAPEGSSIRSSRDQSTQTPPAIDVGTSAAMATEQRQSPLSIWAVDVSEWLESASDADPGTIAEELLRSTPEAVTKVKRFVRVVDRARALAGQLLPRLVYAQGYALAWSQLRFVSTREGRPYLSSPTAEGMTDYNVTHDGDWVAVAFYNASAARKNGARVGIDVMSRSLPRYESSVRDFVDTMDMTMTPAEKDWVLAANPSAQSTGSRLLSREEQRASKASLSASDQEMLARQYDLWTYKEALTKNLGMGLGFDFAKIELALWECGADRDRRSATKPVLRMDDRDEGAYRFTEIILPPGAKSVDEGNAPSQLVVAEGPLADPAAQVSPALSAQEAQQRGLLRIFSMQELITASRKQLAST